MNVEDLTPGDLSRASLVELGHQVRSRLADGQPLELALIEAVHARGWVLLSKVLDSTPAWCRFTLMSPVDGTRFATDVVVVIPWEMTRTSALATMLGVPLGAAALQSAVRDDPAGDPLPGWGSMREQLDAHIELNDRITRLSDEQLDRVSKERASRRWPMPKTDFTALEKLVTRAEKDSDT